MTKLNMVNMNTLFKKAYFLAGVMMAANIFVGNKMKAMETKQPMSSKKNDLNTNQLNIKLIEEKIQPGEQNNSDSPGKNTSPLKMGFNFVLSHENVITLFGGLAFSCVNNYLKWWDYNPGTYCKFVWFGWRSKRFLYDVVQFELNLNLVRGISWSILHIINFIMMKKLKKGKKSVVPSLVGFFFKDILRGFTSMPLTFHISNFSISFSLDSIIWAGVDYILKPRGEEVKKNEGNNQIEIEDSNSNKELNSNPEENKNNTKPDIKA